MLPDSVLQERADGPIKTLVGRLEIQDDACKRAVLSRDGEAIRRRCGGGGGGDGDFGAGGDFGGGDIGGSGGEISSEPTENIDIPIVEVHGNLNDPSPNPDPDPNPGTTTTGADPQLIALNEEKGLSWGCALKSALGGWEAGLACALLEEKYGPASSPPPPKSAATPPAPASTPMPPPPAPKPAAPIPAPSKGPSGGGRGTGPIRMVPRGMSLASMVDRRRR
ncbi:MAG: hypothetical protein Q9184_006934 [Pyrenodesmia sp. 2 TL-2023]